MLKMHSTVRIHRIDASVKFYIDTQSGNMKHVWVNARGPGALNSPGPLIKVVCKKEISKIVLIGAKHDI
ncbi:MAG: hypothetical protein K0S22_230 [Oscillospiraceae bacterium]|nr:hypothetical protein [Oscillospiraceae bacterium]